MFAKIIAQIDRWGTMLLVFLIPWQARIIFRQGFLAGAPSEPQTVSLYALEVGILIMLIIRLFALTGGKRKYALRAINKIFVAFAAFILISIFSVIVSFDPLATIVASLHLLEGMALFFIIVTAPCEREARFAFLAAALVQSAVAIGEFIYGYVPGGTILGMSAQSAQTAGASVVEAGAMRILRAYGTLPHPNILGGMIVAAILLSRSLFRRVSVLSTAAYIVLATGLFLTFSRLAWIALAAGLILQWFFARRDRVFLANAGIVIAVLALLAGFFWPFLFVRVSATGRLEQKSVDARITSLQDGYKLIVARPLAGSGAGAMTAAVFQSVDSHRGAYGYEPAHNVFVLEFAEIGLFGLIIFLILFYDLTLMAWASGKPGLAAALIVFAAGDHWPVTTFAGVMIFFAAWALSLRGCNDGKITHKSGAIIFSEKDSSKILLLYRDGPGYCDWTFPKGHMEVAESYEDAMRREVWEETGLVVDIICQLPNREYVTGHGHDALAHFFLVRSLDDSKLRVEPLHPNNKLAWAPVAEVESRLTFENLKEYFRKIKPEIQL
jgi:8-oxo-dGTP pyrophosphatase MutT (NUDIX family)/O-antigen ligase